MKVRCPHCDEVVIVPDQAFHIYTSIVCAYCGLDIMKGGKPVEQIREPLAIKRGTAAKISPG